MSFQRRPSVGLPSTPRARTFTASQVRQDQDPIPRPRSSASERPPPSSYATPPPLPTQARALRPARSIGALPVRPAPSVRSRSVERGTEPRRGYGGYGSTDREPPPPLPAMPALPRGPKLGPTQNRREIPAHTSSRSVDYNAYRSRGRGVEEPVSDSSSSSGASDTSAPSPPSSRTSMDEGEMEKMYDSKGKTPAGFGSSLWGNITGVASNLTISVSKAWSSNVTTFAGEETPVGGESRLTRALKAYHIEKARDPADLPDWLFDERERGVRRQQQEEPARAPERERKAAATGRASQLSRSVTTVRRDDDDYDAEPAQAPPRTARGPTLADRKADAATSMSLRAGSDAHVTKSISRLRELRDAKRSAKVRFGDEPDEVIEGPAPPASRSRPVLPVAPPVPVLEPSYEKMPPPTRPRGMPAPGASSGAPLGVRGRQPSTRLGLPSGVRPVRA